VLILGNHVKEGVTRDEQTARPKGAYSPFVSAVLSFDTPEWGEESARDGGRTDGVL